jgi:hypothetical protein
VTASREEANEMSKELGTTLQDTRASLAYRLIREGKGNVEVLDSLIKEFDLEEKHSRYPEVYRANVVMRGEMTPEQARATRGPSIPRQPHEVAGLFAQLKAPGADLPSIIASLPERRPPSSQSSRSRSARDISVHRAWEDGTACGCAAAQMSASLAEVTCPHCLLSFEGWWGPARECLSCCRTEVDGHAEDCELVTGVSPLADLAPFVRAAAGVGMTRRPFLLGRKRALTEKRLQDEALRLREMEADLQTERAKFAALQAEAAGAGTADPRGDVGARASDGEAPPSRRKAKAA